MASSRSSIAELAIAILIVVALLGGLGLYSQTWPPAVIVESGSMMHPHEVLPYGRVGTIDPGDMVLVRDVDARGDVALATDGGKDRYGKAGDVIVYVRNGNPRDTPIIHRAIALIEVAGDPTNEGDPREGGAWEYRVRWKGEWREFGPAGIVMPELGFERGNACCPSGAYTPRWSGFVTQGDNPFTNPRSDQALGINREPVPLEWVKGKARGELPWVGLIKLVFAPAVNDYNAAWVRIGNAYAPRDCWTMLAATLAVLVVAPVGFDAARRRLRSRE